MLRHPCTLCYTQAYYTASQSITKASYLLCGYPILTNLSAPNQRDRNHVIQYRHFYIHQSNVMFYIHLPVVEFYAYFHLLLLVILWPKVTGHVILNGTYLIPAWKITVSGYSCAWCWLRNKNHAGNFLHLYINSIPHIHSVLYCKDMNLLNFVIFWQRHLAKAKSMM